MRTDACQDRHVNPGRASIAFSAATLALASGCGDPKERDQGAPILTSIGGDGDGTDGGGGTQSGADTGDDRLDLPAVPTDSCYAADLLFVIDNSGSMCEAQEGLAMVVPGLVDSMFDTLPQGTDLHVGVVTTSFSHGGSHNEAQCRAAEGPSLIEEAFVLDTVVDHNGYQGRLFEFDGLRYFQARTDDSSARTSLADWFSGAIVAVGCDGGAFDFPVAAAAYAVDSLNEPTNAGFLRDEGAVLAMFVLTNETDHSPDTLASYRQTIIDAKSGCGGEACILTAGLLAPNCVPEWDPPIWQFLSAFGQAPVWGDISDFGGYAQVVAEILAVGLVEACDEIDPVG